jgi:V/A-type H+-transporting ATPase subunit K
LIRGIATFTVVVGALATLLLAKPVMAQTASATKLDPQFVGWAFIAAALSTALAALGAGYAVARVGSAAVGAIAEKPELFGRVLVLVGLAEGIAIYGLIVSILILNRIG